MTITRLPVFLNRKTRKNCSSNSGRIISPTKSALLKLLLKRKLTGGLDWNQDLGGETSARTLRTRQTMSSAAKECSSPNPFISYPPTSMISALSQNYPLMDKGSDEEQEVIFSSARRETTEVIAEYDALQKDLEAQEMNMLSVLEKINAKNKNNGHLPSFSFGTSTSSSQLLLPPSPSLQRPRVQNKSSGIAKELSNSLSDDTLSMLSTSTHHNIGKDSSLLLNQDCTHSQYDKFLQQGSKSHSLVMKIAIKGLLLQMQKTMEKQKY